MLFHTRAIIRKLPGKVIRKVKLPNPEMISGFGSRKDVINIINKYGFKRVLLVTDKTIYSLGLHEKILDSLKEDGIYYDMYYNISSEPNLEIIDGGRKALEEIDAYCIIALGGGAVMDSCKIIAAGGKLKKKKSASLLKKFLFVKEKTIPIITIPTTAGTGAEITVGSVVTNQKGKKVATVVVGLNVIGVILDSELTINAPRNITLSCGIDALSHGLEGVVSSVKVKEEDKIKSMECVKLVLENLPVLIDDSKNIKARANMTLAANYGGNAINKQLAGYIHAFAHTIGAKYHIPHGNAIAMSLIPVMNMQKNKCITKLAELSRYCGYSKDESDDLACDKLLNEIDKLINLCAFENKGFIKKEDYKTIAKGVALDSINYSAPIVLTNKQIYAVLDEINK